MMKVSEWIKRFEIAVCGRDYSAACALFDFRVIGFGTQIVRADGLRQLEELQWAKTWPKTEGFYFNKWDFISGRDGIITVIATWESSASETQKRRHGRATIILQHCTVLDELLCIHSHFSLNPVPEFG